MLRKDYDIVCWEDTRWWILAVASCLGLVVISFGFPIMMGVWMRSVMKKELQEVRHGKKGRAIAHRDFRVKFSYIAVSLAYPCHCCRRDGRAH